MPRLTTMCRKIGAPMRAMTTPSGSSAGRKAMRATTSPISTSAPPSNALAGSYHAVVRPGEQPHQMRDDDADEADHAGHGHGGADAGSRRDDDQALGGFHVDAEVEGLRLAQQQAVERAHQPRQHQAGQQREGQDRHHFRPAGAGQAAEHPQREVAQLAVVAGKGDEPRERAAEGAERNAGKQQCAGRQLALPADDRHQQGGGGESAAEGGEGQRVDAERPGPRGGQPVAQRDRRHGCQRGSRGDADQARIGQRIAEHALHHGAGDSQRRADEGTEQQPRQADVEEHQLLARGRSVCLAGDRSAKDARQGGERDARRADRERQDRGNNERHGGKRDELAAARRSGALARLPADGQDARHRTAARAGEIGIELQHEVAGRGWSARAEAQQVQAIHDHQPPIDAGRRRIRGPSAQTAHRHRGRRWPVAPHGDDHLRRQLDDGLVRQRTKAVDGGCHVLRAGKLEDGVGTRALTADHGAPVLHGQHEQSAQRPLDAFGVLGQRLEVRLDLPGEPLALGLRADGPRDQPDLGDDAGSRVLVGDLDIGDARGLQRLDDLGRPRASEASTSVALTEMTPSLDSARM